MLLKVKRNEPKMKSLSNYYKSPREFFDFAIANKLITLNGICKLKFTIKKKIHLRIAS